MKNKTQISILLIGPLSPPITGNSLANDIVVKGLKKTNFITIDFINTQLEDFKDDIGKFRIKKLGFIINKYFKLYKVLSNDIIYITPGQTFYGVLKYAPFIHLAKLLQKQVVIHIHGNYLKTQYGLLSGMRKYFFEKTLKKADKGIVLSKSLLGNLTPFLPLSNIYIVPNFVENYLRPLNFKIRKDEPLKILFLSNLMKEKGVLDLLKALRILKENNIEFEAKLAGNIEGKIKSILTPLFNSKEIKYLGVITGQQKKELLKWSNVFVLPTYYNMEGVPISILEAMANGNIIVTTKHAGIPDIISERNGFFVKPQSYKSIANQLIYIGSNLNDLKDIRLNNLKDSQKYTDENYINSLLSIFTR